MEFTVLERNENFPKNAKNLACLRIDHWNDFSFVTMFYLSVLDETGIEHNIGYIKIGFKGQTTETPTYEKLNNNFLKLSPNFFSVGADIDFYKNLFLLDEQVAKNILVSLNDVAFNQDIINRVKDEEVFGTSLLRDSSLTSIRGQYARIIYGKPELTDFKFSFIRDYMDDTYPIELDFNVEAGSTPSTNIHALIGRNGSGKTTILNGMIDAIINKQDSLHHFIDNLRRNKRIYSDYFSSLISVSFSAFDPFSPPKEQPDPSKGTCYFYIGLKDQKNLINF